MAIRISQDEIERVRREIIERGKIEAPGEMSIAEDEEPEQASDLEDDEEDLPRDSSRPVSSDYASSDLPEVQTLAGRLFKGRIEGARQGRHQSGPSPYGYRRGRKGLVIDVIEAENVRFIFREYLRVRSMHRLIQLLDGRGIHTRRGKKWSRAAVSWILKNDTYIGRVHFGDVKTRGVHEAIIASIIFNKAAKLIRANNKVRGRHKVPERAIIVPPITE